MQNFQRKDSKPIVNDKLYVCCWDITIAKLRAVPSKEAELELKGT